MTVVNIPNRPIGSEDRSIAAILADFDAITNVVNGQIDGTHNIAAKSILTSNLADELIDTLQLQDKCVTKAKLSEELQKALEGKITVGAWIPLAFLAKCTSVGAHEAAARFELGGLVIRLRGKLKLNAEAKNGEVLAQLGAGMENAYGEIGLQGVVFVAAALAVQGAALFNGHELYLDGLILPLT